MKGWGKLLGAFSTTSKAEFALIYKVQACCYEDAKLMKLFPEVGCSHIPAKYMFIVPHVVFIFERSH